MATPFMGMRGTGDWATNQVPESWGQVILREFPNGSAPLYAMTSMMRQETVNSYKYHWWSKTMPTQSGSGSVYIDPALGTAYVYATHQATAGTAGGVVYVKCSANLSKEFNKGALAMLRDSDQPTVDVRGVVQKNFQNGASSWVAVKLIEDDDNHSDSSTYNLATVDTIMRYSSGYPEGSTAPVSVNYDPDEYDNYVQNYRNTIDQTLTALATNLRTGDAKKEAKLECAMLHSMDIEKSAFWGEKYNGTGENGKPLRLTQGMIPFLAENNSSNIVDFQNTTGADYAGKTWLQAGKKFLNTYLFQLARYLDTGEVMAYCGDGALLGIQELAEAYGDIKLEVAAKSYGIDVTTWVIPGLKVHFKTHPLFSHETTNRNMIVLLHPKNCKFCPLVGGGKNFRTKWEKNMQIPGQHSEVDGFSTKGGWKFYHPNQFMVMYGMGLDNVA